MKFVNKYLRLKACKYCHETIRFKLLQSITNAGYVSEIHIITDLIMGQGIQELTK